MKEALRSKTTQRIASQSSQSDGKVQRLAEVAVDQSLEEFQLAMERIERAMFTFDGAIPTVSAVIRNLSERCKMLEIELFKYAAACSLVQQANNTSRSYHLMHQGFRHVDTTTVSIDTASPYMQQFLRGTLRSSSFCEVH